MIQKLLFLLIVCKVGASTKIRDWLQLVSDHSWPCPALVSEEACGSCHKIVADVNCNDNDGRADYRFKVCWYYYFHFCLDVDVRAPWLHRSVCRWFKSVQPSSF